ncbi:hypothetical protein SAMN05428938_8339 [Streptomyces sp. KS_5]|nr:hypothetical protein SAMN05428938_8339 [Streptomyces sp. KS_5]
MRAHLGDQLVIESPAAGVTRRDGEIVGLHHADGTPPYDVRWSDTDAVTLVSPGPDAHIRRVEHGRPGTAHEFSRPYTGEAETADTVSQPTGILNPGDVGRRVAVERRRQKLCRVETARRARMSPGYLAYLEERPADPTVGTLIRLADALGIPVTALRGGGIELPPGQGHALLHPQLSDLGPRACRTVLSTHGGGAYRGDGVRRTSGGRPGQLRGRRQRDHVPDRARLRSRGRRGNGRRLRGRPCRRGSEPGLERARGGPGSVVTEPDAVRRLAERAHSRPSAGGQREIWVSVRPTSLTGRRITPTDHSSRAGIPALCPGPATQPQRDSRERAAPALRHY